MKGIDVSRYQKDIDFEKVKADGIDFVIIRSSYGRNTSSYVNKGVDEKYEVNYKNARKAGLNIGAYHYCYANNVQQSREEAQFFLKMLRSKLFEYPVVLDIENEKYRNMNKNLVTDIAIAFLEVLEAAGYFAMIYSYRYFFQHYINDSRLSKYAHWVAEYNNSLNYKGHYGIWQHTSVGKVNGITTNVDLNISYVNYPSIIRSSRLNGFASSPVEDKTSEESFLYYTIKRGDTLSEIASKYRTTIARLKELNSIKDVNKIYTGQQLKIPISGGNEVVFYTVVKGDSLTAIAKRFNTSVSKLVKDNNISNPDLIYTGQILKIN